MKVTRLERILQRWLSHYPILYGIIGGVGIVLFWRGVWHTVDYLMLFWRHSSAGQTTTDLVNETWWDGPLSLVVGSAILLVTSLFVSSLIGNEVIMSGLRGDKRLTEKTETEVKTEAHAISEIREKLDQVLKAIERRKR